VLLGALALLAGASFGGAQDRSERPIGPGVRLLQWTRPDGPYALQAVEVDRSQGFIRLGVSQGGGDAMALESLSRQAERVTRLDRYPIAGVNGDFFLYPNTRQSGIPTNAAVLDGELLHTPFQRSCLVIDAAGNPSIKIFQNRSLLVLPNGAQRAIDAVNHPRGRNQLVLYTPRYGTTTRTDATGVEVYLQPEEFPLRSGGTQKARVRAVQAGVGGGAVNPGTWVLSGSGPAGTLLRGLQQNDVVELRMAFDPAFGPKDQVLGGGPRLVRDGKVAVEPEGGSINGAFATTRHPRTALGYNGTRFYLLVVDGRQPGYSVGMSLAELAQAMADLGCTDAINVDGGGSSALWVRGVVVNHPSDGRERAVANGLFVLSSAPKGDPVRLVPSVPEIAALPGAEVPLSVGGEDQYYNPVAVPGERVAWTVDPTLGTVRQGRFVAAEPTLPPGQEFLAGTLHAESGGVAADLPVRVYGKPARVTVLPATARVGLQAQSAFRVAAFNSQGKPLALPATIRWDAAPELGMIDAAGTLATGAANARGAVTATIAGVSGAAQVEVTEAAARALEDFEGMGTWTSRVTPAGVLGSATLASGLARSGKRALRIDYDFNTGSGTRAVYAQGSQNLGAAFALKVWVYGDGQGAWLRARVKDAKGTVHTVDLARNVNWKDSWKELRAPFSDDFPTPLTLESLYIVEPDTALKPKGSILIDDLGVDQ
jgi:hypothetical protein